jgi:hypothetical protein
MIGKQWPQLFCLLVFSYKKNLPVDGAFNEKLYDLKPLKNYLVLVYNLILDLMKGEKILLNINLNVYIFGMLHIYCRI